VFLLRLGQGRELRVSGVIRRQKAFLSMKDRRVEVTFVGSWPRFPGREINRDGVMKCRMWIFKKGWVGQKRNLQFIRPEFDQIMIGCDSAALGGLAKQ
jgi:hypothetical protein